MALITQKRLAYIHYYRKFFKTIYRQIASILRYMDKQSTAQRPMLDLIQIRHFDMLNHSTNRT